MRDYHQFIADKHQRGDRHGFDTPDLPSRLFPHQQAALDFAFRQGRSALFLDTGLGKSGCEVVYADECAKRENRPALILTPLAVARQMQREAEAFGVEARVVREQSEVWTGVNIANYERLPKLDPSAFCAVILDESSILKSFNGSTKRALCEHFAQTPYRMACTATPAPNDHMEIGQHSEFLGYIGSMEMLCRWFINDTSTASQDWRIKGHAASDFWAWVASWARAASLPSDLGGEDAGFILPPLTHELHVVDSQVSEDTGDLLFRIPDQSATSIHKEKKLTLQARCEMAASLADCGEPVIVWCERDDESALITSMIAGAIEVKGSMPLEKKEAALEAFTAGAARVIVTKPKLAGFGLNWQHCARQVFASVTYSYEQYYQAIRRSWRFGQKRPVKAHIVIADTERPIWSTVQRKAADHDRMKAAMASAMREAQRDAEHVEAYTRAPKFEFPKWLEGQDAA